MPLISQRNPIPPATASRMWMLAVAPEVRVPIGAIWSAAVFATRSPVSWIVRAGLRSPRGPRGRRCRRLCRAARRGSSGLEGPCFRRCQFRGCSSGLAELVSLGRLFERTEQGARSCLRPVSTPSLASARSDSADRLPSQRPADVARKALPDGRVMPEAGPARSANERGALGSSGKTALNLARACSGAVHGIAAHALDQPPRPPDLAALSHAHGPLRGHSQRP